MGKVILVMSMSLDGYMRAANPRPEEPLGEGGEQLHDWAMGTDGRGRAILEQGVRAAGAVIAGRRTYDDSIRWWGADGPTGPARLPLFVVSHAAPDDVPDGGVYTFVNGIDAALARAQATAGSKDVSVMGGADVGQQFIDAGLIDEIQIHLVPVLFGGGTRLFDERPGGKPIQLEPINVVDTPAATHLRYRVIKS